MEGKLNDRPLPSLAQWLGDGGRAEGFEDWVRENLAREGAVTEREKATVRLINTLTIACVESLRLEDANGQTAVDTVLLLARCSGVAVMGAVLSIITDDPRAPLLKIARDMASEFEHGAKCMARSRLKQLRSDA